jgi:hypothetical protein
VYIKTNTGSTLSVDLDPKWHIKNVKEIVAPRLGLSPEEVKIIFAGKELHDLIVIEVICFKEYGFHNKYLCVIDCCTFIVCIVVYLMCEVYID